MTVTVLPKTVAALSAAAATPNVKAGALVEVAVKVQRQHDYAGAFKVQVIVPPTVKGLSAAEATIPAGANEVKVRLQVAADAAPGPRNDLVVRATAVLAGNVQAADMEGTLGVSKESLGRNQLERIGIPTTEAPSDYIRGRWTHFGRPD